jgi:inosose dehydratase
VNSLSDLAVQTYCFRKLTDNGDVACAVRECGLSKVELSPVHVNYMNSEERSQCLEAYRKAGIDVVGLGVITMKNDQPAERKAMEFARSAGADMISVTFEPESFQEAVRTAEQLADEFDVRLGIHNHGGRHWLGNAQMLRKVFSDTSARIGLCLDTAWALHSGEDPLRMAMEFRERLYGVHLKDFVFDQAGKPADVIVGHGNLDLTALLMFLQESDFSGPLILEYEGNPNDPVPSVKQCVQSIRGE